MGAQALQTGRMSIGDFAMFTSYIAHLAFVAGMVGGFVKRYRQMSVSLGRGLALLQGAPTAQLVQPSTDLALWRIPSVKLPNEPPLAHEPLNVFEARDLCYSYPGVGSERHGIQHINFSIRRGEFVVITGRIGSGKTTLLRVLLGLLPADSGTLLWNGSVISDPGSFLTPPHVAYTPQTPRLFGDTLRDNILMGLPLTGSRAADLDAALLQAVLERDIPTLEHGLDTRIGPRGVRLSGGQLQRAAAARMFVRMPDLLVFDDLSSALDTETEQLLWSRLRMRPGVTCIVVSHRETALARADRVIHMKDQ